MRTHLIKVLNSLSTALAFSLCASASTLAATHTIGGTVKGLTSTNSVTLLDDGTDALKVTANGAFTFKTPLAAGASYNVTIGTQPTDELCTVTHGSGLANANISSVLVSCVRTFSIGGTLSGLKSGDSVTLLDNRKDALPLTANGKFTFSTRLTTGSAYSVTVITEPLGEKCTISHAKGVVAANVTNIAVSCVAAPMFTIGGSVSGLRAGDSVTLLDNGADPLKVSSNSTFKFKTPLDSGTLFKVTVGTQPSTGDCKVSAATGIVRSSNITTVKVTCVPTFSIGGTLTGLKSGDSLTLLDNRTDALTLTANGKFTFAIRLPSGSAYRLGVNITPLGEKCTVTHGVGVVAGANVTNISVSCVTAPTHTVGGIISGLKTGDQITLLDNGADALTLTASGPFTFKTPLDSGTVYRVIIGTQPPGEDCTVTAGTGVVANANITSVKVTCTTAGTHTIGGTVSGLKTGNSVTLLDNGADALKVTADGRFTFKTPLAPGASYAVTVGTQPAGQICTITNGSGKVPRANVTNVTAICTAAPTFTIGGTLSGLTPGALLSLFNNGADQLNLTTNGAFAFRLGLLPGAAYNVTIASQPTGETCTVSNGSGTVGKSNVTTVSVSCKANLTFTIGGTVSGLNTGASVTLLDNATDSLTVSTNGTFTFKTALATGAAYNVTVNTQPVGETCTVTGATGTVASSNVTTVSVSCKANPTFTIGGTVSGLNTGASVTLLDNATDSLTVSTNGAFTFKTALATGAAYNVTIASQPSNETCTVTGATGTVASANVSNVSVSCATSTFTIGGTVSGLNTGASVTLLDNATDSLTVGTNGAFTFKIALATGAAYSVTVSTQPTGQTCTITNGTGTVASANITNVNVSCSSGTGGSGTFWTPYTASPVPGTNGGSTGLFIMPSDNLESSPAPQFVTTAQPHFLGSAFQFTFGNGTVTSTPAVFIYAAAGTDRNTHVYGLKVGDTSTVPTPTQLSSLSLSPSQQICGFSQAQTSLADPTTVFTILDVSPGQCGTGGDIFEVVHYQDSPTTAPTPVSINTTLIYTLYQDGNLAGLILYDTNAQSLNLYADGTFTSPKQLATGSASLGLRLATLTDGTTFGGTVAYFNVTTSSGPALYRIDSSSLTLSQVHQGVLGLVAVPDKNNLYFTDVTSLSTTVFYQVPLAGGTPTAIYSAPYTSGLSSYLLLGTDDSVLAFQFLTTIGSPIGTTTNFFYTVPIGTTSTTATTLGGPYVGNVTAVVASPKLADFAGTVIFVDIINKLAGTPQQTAYSSVALPLSGTTNTTPLANSSYPPMGPTRIVQVTGITDVDGGQGGGTLSNIDLNTLQGTILTTTGGQPYVIPAGYVPGPVSLGSNFVGGQLVPFPGTTGPSIGLAGDLSNNFILPINLPNTNVSIF